MKIGFNFHTKDEYISGVEYYALGLLDALSKFEPNNSYVVFTNRPALISKYIGKKENITIRDYSKLNTRIKRICWEHIKLPVLVAKDELDLLHCPSYICPIWSLNTPYIITMHDTIAIDQPKFCTNANALYYNLFMKRAVKKATKIISVSEYTKQSILGNFKINSSDIAVIPPGIDDFFTNKSEPQKNLLVKNRYNLPDKYILYVGNIEPKKNLINTLKAFKLLSQKNIKHKFVLVGKRSWKSEGIWRYIKENFTENQIIITGYVEREELASIYRQADIFVFASKVEGFGFPPLEAIKCGTAVVSSKTGILKQFDNESFAQINPENPESIANAVTKIISDNKYKNNLITLASKQVEKFSWEKTAKRTFEIYKQAAHFKVHDNINLKTVSL